jgi:peptide/nickel transport system substrate-binding protein
MALHIRAVECGPSDVAVARNGAVGGPISIPSRRRTVMRSEARRRRVMAALALLISIGVVVGPAGAANVAKRPLVVNISCSPNSLDPAAARSGPCGLISWHLYSTLVVWAKKPGPFPGTLVWDKSKVVPGVAQSWDISKDGRKYTFHLNPKAKFPDGTPITAQVVKFNVDRDHSTGATANTFWLAGQNDNFPKVTTPNRRTVVFELPVRPNGDFLNGVAQASMLVQPSKIAERPDTVNPNGTVTVNPYWGTNVAGGGGPFLLVSYTPGRQIVLRKNPDYVGPSVGPPRLIINFVADETARLLQARSGAADVTLELSPQAATSLQGSGGLRVNWFPSSNWIDLGFVWKNRPFDNVKVREAMTHAVPIRQIHKNIALGHGKLFYGPIPPGFEGYNPDLAGPQKVPKYDLALTRRLLAQSGVKLPVDIDFAIVQGDIAGTQIATTLQSLWKPLGFNINLKVLPSAQFNSVVFAGQTNMYTFTDGAALGTPGALLAFDMQCNVFANRAFMCMPDADKAYFKGRTLLTPQKRQKYWDKVTRIWQSNFPKIPLYSLDVPVVLGKDMKTFYFFSSLYYFNYNELK